MRDDLHTPMIRRGCGCSPMGGAVCEKGKKLEAEVERTYSLYIQLLGLNAFARTHNQAELNWKAACTAWHQHLKEAGEQE